MSLEKSIASAALSAAFQPAPVLGRQQMEGGAVPVKPVPTYAPPRDYLRNAVTFSNPISPAQTYRKQGEIMRTGYSSAPSRAPEGYNAALFGLPPALYGSSPDTRYS